VISKLSSIKLSIQALLIISFSHCFSKSYQSTKYQPAMSFLNPTCVVQVQHELYHTKINATTSDFSSCIVELPLSPGELEPLAIFCVVLSALGILALAFFLVWHFTRAHTLKTAYKLPSYELHQKLEEQVRGKKPDVVRYKSTTHEDDERTMIRSITIIEDITQDPQRIPKKESNNWVARKWREYMVWLRGVQARNYTRQRGENPRPVNWGARSAMDIELMNIAVGSRRETTPQLDMLDPRRSSLDLGPPLPTYTASGPLGRVPSYASASFV
jgi:hypothetical protein